MVKHMTNDRLAKNATSPSRRVNRRFASTAFGEGYGDMTPEERAARKAWLESSNARERQLIEIAGQALRGYADAPMDDRNPE